MFKLRLDLLSPTEQTDRHSTLRREFCNLRNEKIRPNGGRDNRKLYILHFLHTYLFSRLICETNNYIALLCVVTSL